MQIQEVKAKAERDIEACEKKMAEGKAKAERDIEDVQAKIKELLQQLNARTLENGQLQSELEVSKKSTAEAQQQIQEAKMKAEKEAEALEAKKSKAEKEVEACEKKLAEAKSQAERDIEGFKAKVTELMQQLNARTLENGQLQSELGVATRSAAEAHQQVNARNTQHALQTGLNLICGLTCTDPTSEVKGREGYRSP